jgi:hypothetical protein
MRGTTVKIISLYSNLCGHVLGKGHYCLAFDVNLSG